MNRSSAILPPGFRFNPTDEELIIYYLNQKVSSSSNPLLSIIADVNIYKFDPWELPDKASFGENEWFFFSPRERKYPKGKRPNRAAASGYWKATGTDKPIISSVGSQCLGMKKSLVFYKGRPPKGVKTDWIMVEYRLLDGYFLSQRDKGSMRLDNWVLCRVHQKSKAPPQITGGRNCDSSSSCSPPFSRGCLQGQEMMIMDNYTIPQGNKYQLPAEYQMTPLESEELDDQNGQMEFHEGSPDYSLSTFNSQTTMDSNVRDVLKSIERVLSVGALDELQLPSQPEKRLKASTSRNTTGNASVFQISSPERFSDF
ncbi:hypothetical protein DITRI_Ditri02bG0037300 [Diplodiscus trichospermus]